jgi:hypothetical protein
MGYTRYYTIFDRAAIDPVWDLPWSEFLQRYRPRRKAVVELLEFGLEPEPTRAQAEDILARRTLKWTIRRCSPQFFIMGELLSLVSSSERHATSLRLACLDESAIVVALAAGRFRDGHVSRSTLRAICKLHSLAGLDGQRGVARLLTLSDLRRALYSWQGNQACLYSPTGAIDDLDNCLGTADTRRFLRFLDRCWMEDCPLPESIGRLADRCGHLHPAQRPWRFRRLEIATSLRATLRAVSRFRTPAMWNETT